jgi:hypothetical protein
VLRCAGPQNGERVERRPRGSFPATRLAAMSDVPAAQGRHANRLLSALDAEALAHLERHLHPAMLRAGTVLYEPGVRIEHAYFPHNCIISLLAVLGDGQTAEVALFGCEGVAGYASSRISREACGRYLVQVPGTASR